MYRAYEVMAVRQVNYIELNLDNNVLSLTRRSSPAPKPLSLSIVTLFLSLYIKRATPRTISMTKTYLRRG